MKPLLTRRFFAGLAAALVGGVGLFTLGAWVLDLWELVAMGSGYIPMAPITALLFVILAAALAGRVWLAGRRSVGWATHAGVGLVLAVAGAELVRLAWPVSLPWDNWGFGVETGFGVVQIGRMASLTAVVFILTAVGFTGTGTTFAANRWVRYPANLAAFAGLLVGGFVVVAYAAGTPLGYMQGNVPMAWLTATAFLLLNAGIIIENEAGGYFNAWRMDDRHEDQVRHVARSYRQRLLLILVLVLGASGLAGFFILRQERTVMRHNVEQQLEAVVNLKVKQIERWWRPHLIDAQLVSTMPQWTEWLEALSGAPAGAEAARTALAEYLRMMRRVHGYRQIVVWDRNLKPVFISAVDPAEELCLPDELVRRIREAKEPLMQDLHRVGQGRVHMGLLAPVRSRDGDQFVGAVQLVVDPSVELYPLVKEWPTSSETGETVLARPDGSDVLFLSELRNNAGSPLQLRIPLDSPTLMLARAMRSGIPGLIEGTDYRGVPTVGVVRRVPGTSWFMIAKMDQVEAYAALRNELATVIVGLLLIAGFVGLFLRSVWQAKQKELTYQQLHLERKARVSSERLALVMQHAGEVILLFDENMRIVEANQRVQEVYGYTPEEMTRLRAQDLRNVESTVSTEADFAKALGSSGLTFETIHVRRDGSTFPVEVSARAVEIDGRRHVLSIIRDISLRRLQDEEIARLSRLYYVISQINKTLLRVKTREELFAEVCKILVDVGGFRIAWIGWLDQASGMVRPVSIAGDEHGYVPGIRISVDPYVPEGRGPSGTAMREGRIVVCNDYFSDPSTLPWRERAAKSGFRSSIALPLRSEGRAMGLLTVYSEFVEFFAPREVELLEETVENMAFALEVFAQEARRKTVEAEQAKLSLAVEQSPSSIVITDLAGNIEYVNPRFTAVTGYTLDEVRGQNPRMLKSGLTDPKVYDELWRTITRGELWRGEIINRKKNGDHYPEMVLVAPVKDAAGRTTHYLALKEDISERKRVEAALVAGEAKFRRLFTMVPLPMGHSDAQGRITFANERFYRTFGYEAAEVPTVQDWLDRAYPDTQYRSVLAARWDLHLAQAAAGNGEIAAMESRVTCKDGQVRTVEISGMLVGGEMLITFVDISERVKADKLMRQMSRIIEQAPLSIAITDLKGAIEYVNPAFLRVTGYAEAEVLGQNPRVLKSGLTPQAVYTDMWNTLARGQVWSGELSNKMKNGEIYHERAVIAPVADDTGRVTHYVALKEDVTRTKQTEDELRLSTERFRALFETNLDGVMITLPSGEIIAANPAACAILGRPESKLIGLGRPDVIDAADTRLAPLLEERRRTGKARGILTMVRGDGTRFEADISSAVFGSGSEQRNGLFIRDITDQIRAQEQMRRFNEELEAKVSLRTEEIALANNQMQALLQSVPDLVLRVDRQGTVLNYQPAKGATPLASIAREEVAETRTGTAGALRALVDAVGSKVLAGNASVVEEHELPAATGTVAVELRAAPVSGQDFVVFARDVTARKRFEAEMAAMLEREHQISEMKTRFISVTSHEFRTPMAAALGSVELLTNHHDRLLPAKRFELLARISQALGRMSEMLDEILLLNRMDANRVEVRLAPVDLLLFVRNLLDEIRLGDKAGHVIELESTGETAGFVTDTNLLHHILGNILSNAVRYSPAGSRIAVRLAVEAGTMRFAVEDQGIGIPEQDIKRIFEPFERGSNVGNIKGTGLGLNIVKRMADMLQGQIAVRSAPTGSCFTITIPSQPAKPTPT